jgi:rSAM/selenodomain-associated transferase 2
MNPAFGAIISSSNRAGIHVKMKSAFFGLLCLAWLADMAALSAIGPLGRHVPASMALYGCGFILLALMFHVFPEKLKASHALCLILAMGLAARVAFLFFPPNTDIYRYIWEGAIQGRGFNPYLFAPTDPALAPLAQGDLGDVWRQINNKPFTAIYPPAATLLFRILAMISPTALFFKSVIMMFDVGVMAILAVILRLRQLPPSRLLFYAANPLAIVFVAGEGHMDSLQVFFLLLGCSFLLRRRHHFGILSLGVAVMFKYLAVAAGPFFWLRRAGFRQLALLLLPAVSFLAYMSAGARVFSSLGEFGVNMHYNDGLMELLRMALGDGALAAAAALFLLALTWVWLTEDDPLRGIYLVIGCLLILLPTLHPWYLLLVAPFICFFPSRAWLYLQLAMLFTFPVLGHEFRTDVFKEVPSLKFLEYIPFFILLVWGIFRGAHFSDKGPFSIPETISVIIPTLNEAHSVGGCLAALQIQPRIIEVIVADGGSTDGTPDAARAQGGRVIRVEPGRGGQIRVAAETARGDVLLILHADAILERDAPERLIRALAEDRSAPGGCFGMRFADAGLKRRLIAGLNNLKAFATGIAFGDQAQFFRAAALRKMEGFPGLMLMEDVELSLRLKRLGRPVYLGRGVTVSGRRWQEGFFLKNTWLVLGLFFRYMLERRLGQVKDGSYYQKYYGSKI